MGSPSNKLLNILILFSLNLNKLYTLFVELFLILSSVSLHFN